MLDASDRREKILTRHTCKIGRRAERVERNGRLRRKRRAEDGKWIRGRLRSGLVEG